MSGEAIYGALTQKYRRKVRELCQGHPEGPFSGTNPAQRLCAPKGFIFQTSGFGAGLAR